MGTWREGLRVPSVLSATDLIPELGQGGIRSLAELGLRRPCLLESAVHAQSGTSITHLRADGN